MLGKLGNLPITILRPTVTTVVDGRVLIAMADQQTGRAAAPGPLPGSSHIVPERYRQAECSGAAGSVFAESAILLHPTLTPATFPNAFCPDFHGKWTMRREVS